MWVRQSGGKWKKVGKSDKTCYLLHMEILELVAEKALGKSVLARHSKLKSGLRKIDKNAGTRPASQTSPDEKQRIAGIIELCFEYKRESDPEERQNILPYAR